VHESLSLQGTAPIDVDHDDNDVGCPIGMTGRTTSSPDCTKAIQRAGAVFVLDEVIALRLVVGGSTDIDAGVDPHTVMQWSGHRTESMLRRYHIIELDDLRRVGTQASDYRGAERQRQPASLRERPP
jgi:hypothetical protein